MKIKKIHLLVFAVIVLTIFFTNSMMRLTDANKECNENPFIYGAKLMNEKETPILCSCSSFQGEFTFWYDEKGMYENNPLIRIEEAKDDFNYSDVKFVKP